jgi:hypothetical protein
MAGLYDGQEELAFKPIDGGYLFKEPSRWIIGPPQYYFVNEGQKQEIAAALRQLRRDMMPLSIIGAIVVMVVFAAGTFALLTAHAPPATLIALFVVVFGPFFAVIYGFRQKRMRPLIAGLPRSEEQFTVADRLAGWATKVSAKFLFFWLAIGLFNIASDLLKTFDTLKNSRPILDPGLTLFHFITSALVVVFVSYLLSLRMFLAGKESPARHVFVGPGRVLAAFAGVAILLAIAGPAWVIATARDAAVAAARSCDFNPDAWMVATGAKSGNTASFAGKFASGDRLHITVEFDNGGNYAYALSGAFAPQRLSALTTNLGEGTITMKTNGESGTFSGTGAGKGTLTVDLTIKTGGEGTLSLTKTDDTPNRQGRIIAVTCTRATPAISL